MNSGSHEEWLKARSEEKQQQDQVLLSKGKTVARVLGTIVAASVVLYVLGHAALVGILPAIVGIWLAAVWFKAYPPMGECDVLLAARKYPWSSGREFQKRARAAFQMPCWWDFLIDRKDSSDFFNEKETHSTLARDLPDLNRIGSDEQYARPMWATRRRRRYIGLVALSCLLNILFIFDLPLLCIAAVITTALLLRPISQAAAGGPLQSFMLAHQRLAILIRRKEEAESSALTAEQLRALTAADGK